MNPAPPEIVKCYTTLLERAILNLRTRLRYGEKITPQELIDYLSALENIPTMLRNYGKWHIEDNIDWHLARYDQNWLGATPSELRRSLVDTLRLAKNGEFDPPT